MYQPTTYLSSKKLTIPSLPNNIKVKAHVKQNNMPYRIQEDTNQKFLCGNEKANNIGYGCREWIGHRTTFWKIRI